MPKRLTRMFVLALLFGSAGCPGEPPESTAEERTRRQKDSIIAELPVPGASGVGRALDALEASEARAQAHDSIS